MVEFEMMWPPAVSRRYRLKSSERMQHEINSNWVIDLPESWERLELNGNSFFRKTKTNGFISFVDQKLGGQSTEEMFKSIEEKLVHNRQIYKKVEFGSFKGFRTETHVVPSLFSRILFRNKEVFGKEWQLVSGILLLIIGYHTNNSLKDIEIQEDLSELDVAMQSLRRI